MVTIVVLGVEDPVASGRALQTIREQTAIDRVEELIFCGAWNPNFDSYAGDLPVRVAPGFPSTELRVLTETVSTPRVAFLCNGDCWRPDHLELCLDFLEKNQQCVAAYGNYLERTGVGYPPHSSRTVWRVWLASGQNLAPPVVHLDETAVMLASLLGANLHMSTLLARTDAFKAAANEVAGSKSRCHDLRVLPTRLVRRGTLAYVTAPRVIVETRDEPGLPFGFRSAEHSERSAETTKWLRQTEPEKVAQATKRFNEVAAVLPRTGPPNEAFPSLATVLHGIGAAEWQALFDCGFALLPPKAPSPLAKRIFRQICPPALMSLAQRVSSAINREKAAR